MRFNIPAILIVTSLLGTEGLAADLRWRVYQDAGFGCVLDYPAGLFRPKAVPPGKPRLFSGQRGDAYFRVQGMDNPERWSPQIIRDKYLSANIPGDLTYDRTRSDFVVLSGHRGANIFYTKVAISSDRSSACILEITYPRVQKEAFDRIVTRMSRSLRFSRSLRAGSPEKLIGGFEISSAGVESGRVVQHIRSRF